MARPARICIKERGKNAIIGENARVICSLHLISICKCARLKHRGKTRQRNSNVIVFVRLQTGEETTLQLRSRIVSAVEGKWVDKEKLGKERRRSDTTATIFSSVRSMHLSIVIKREGPRFFANVRNNVPCRNADWLDRFRNVLFSYVISAWANSIIKKKDDGSKYEVTEWKITNRSK